MKLETIFLKIAVCIISIPILALYILGLPSITSEAVEYYSAILAYPVLISMYLAAIPFFFALYQTFKLLSYIDKNKAFSELSISALKSIKYCAFTIGILFVVAMPFLYFIAQKDDAPGILAIGLIITSFSVVIAVFTSVLQKLLKKAIDVKLN